MTSTVGSDNDIKVTDDVWLWLVGLSDPDCPPHQAIADLWAIQERQRQLVEQSRSRTQPRQIPDVEAAMAAAIEVLRTNHVRLTWPNTAMEIARQAALDSLGESTLRRWADEDKLPHPSDRSWWVRPIASD